MLTGEEIKAVMFNDIQSINHMYRSRNVCFQIPGQQDGSISEECKQLFAKQYEFWDELIAEYESRKGAGE